ncbi:MAG: transposase family protein [Deltaproteobacteria bacterium]|nr:transposase family protein [Deltaproteobacteria bacterium]
MHHKKHLSFTALRKALSEHISKLDDRRQSGKVNYSLHDCLMSAFAMMFFQDPSLLAFQKRMQDSIQTSNLTTMFGVNDIPSDTQIREILDPLSPAVLEPVFSDFLHRLQRGKHLVNYQFYNEMYLVSVGGSEYFSSKTIHCPHCRVSVFKGKKRYHHQIVQSVIVHPDMRQVLPLAPEQVSKGDGTKKQDCEINASKRVVHNIRATYPKLKIIITADALYSKQPFISEAKKEKISFILAAKPKDHKVLFEWVHELTQLGDGDSFEYTDAKGRRHCYQWINDVPLNGTKDADSVNFFQYQIVSTNGKVAYKNSWVTDIIVDKNNVVTLVKGGRARWKIENETFNTLKNQGYHLEHNFGHGKQNLSMIFFMLNVLAFYVHQILELTDNLYQTVRYQKFTSRKEYWNQLRCTIRILIFPRWESLLQFILDPEKGIPP